MAGVLTIQATLTLGDRFDRRVFDALYSRSLVYNTCWEDPAVDRQALALGKCDRMVVITSAGCNVLDYALTGVRHIDAVDANPRQTALLELKIAGIRRLAHRDFFMLFGEGFHPRAEQVYRDVLRGELAGFSRAFWDRHIDWFASPRRGFFYRGLSGVVASGMRLYLRARPALERGMQALLEAGDIPAQRAIYRERVRPLLWREPVNWLLGRQITMSLLGVPYPQRREVQAQHAGGVAAFVRDAVDYIACELPMTSNYFWSVYVRGRYSPSCCPEYLKPANFEALREGLVDRIRPHTTTVTGLLRASDARVSRFVLLDHMDWMSAYDPHGLAEEWSWILSRASDDARVIFRSAHAKPAYLDALRARNAAFRDRVVFQQALAERLNREDRVHTYAGFHIADLRPA